MLEKVVKELRGGKQIESDAKLDQILIKHVNGCKKDSMVCTVCQHIDTKCFEKKLCVEKLCQIWLLVRDHFVRQGLKIDNA